VGYYTINELEAISGIKAHTIRIWEQRYDLLQPERTDTNIRRYTDRDFKKLLNTVSLMRYGLKISKIGLLTYEEIEAEVRKYQHQESGNYEAWINSMVVAMINYDEEEFEKIYTQLAMRFGLRDVFINVIYPFLRKIGYLWLSEGLMPAQEHFASNLIRQKLFSVIDDLTVDRTKKEVFILFLPDNEDHEIPLLFSSWIIQSFGYKVVYLGQRLPLENLVETVKQTSATHLVTFFISSLNAPKIQKQLDEISEKFSDLTIYFSGNEFTLSNINIPSNAVWTKDVRDLEKIL